MGKLDKRHHVPAAVIGQFSDEKDVLPARRRRVAVHRFDPPASFVTRAENVGFGRDLYRGSRHLGIDNDRYLAQFEGMALRPVDELLDSNWTVPGIPLDIWAQTAGYVASQFARAPDLERSLDELAALKNVPREKIDVGYLLNLPRVAAAVLRARWDLVGTRSDLILNDRGITPAYFHDLEAQGYLVPLRRRFAVRIVGGPVEHQLTWRQGKWWIDLEFVGLAGRWVEVLNEMTYASAVAEVYAPTVEMLGHLAEVGQSARANTPELRDLIQGAGLLGLSSDQRRRDEGLLMVCCVTAFRRRPPAAVASACCSNGLVRRPAALRLSGLLEHRPQDRCPTRLDLGARRDAQFWAAHLFWVWLGFRGTPNTALAFGDGTWSPGGKAGAIGYLVGKPGEGLKQMFHMMNAARIEIGLGASALGFAGFAASLDYAKQRRQGRPVSRDGVGSDTDGRPHHRGSDASRGFLRAPAFRCALATTLGPRRLHPAHVLRHGWLRRRAPDRHGEALRQQQPRPSTGGIPHLGLDRPIVALGARGSTMQLPPPTGVGWWSGSVTPGQPGVTIVTGFIRTQTGIPGAFHRLRDLKPHDLISLTLADGDPAAYLVTSIRAYPAGTLPSGQIFSNTSVPTLKLVTTGGALKPGDPNENVVVTSVAAPGQGTR